MTEREEKYRNENKLLKTEIKRLEKELYRKERDLMQMQALLGLKKKVKDIIEKKKMESLR